MEVTGAIVTNLKLDDNFQFDFELKEYIKKRSPIVSPIRKGSDKSLLLQSEF
jgi:hypothetical protein